MVNIKIISNTTHSKLEVSTNAKTWGELCDENSQVADMSAGLKVVEKDSSLSLAYRLVAELIAGFAVGGFIGYKIDEWTGSSPVFMIICMFLAFFGSVLNIYRIIIKDND